MRLHKHVFPESMDFNTVCVTYVTHKIKRRPPLTSFFIMGLACHLRNTRKPTRCALCNISPIFIDTLDLMSLVETFIIHYGIMRKGKPNVSLAWTNADRQVNDDDEVATHFPYSPLFNVQKVRSLKLN